VLKEAGLNYPARFSISECSGAPITRNPPTISATSIGSALCALQGTAYVGASLVSPHLRTGEAVFESLVDRAVEVDGSEDAHGQGENGEILESGLGRQRKTSG
jgi:hypothetical protein